MVLVMRVSEDDVLRSAAAKGGSGGLRNGALPKEATHPDSRSSTQDDRLHYPGSKGFKPTLLPRTYENSSFWTTTHHEDSESYLLELKPREYNNILLQIITIYFFGNKDQPFTLSSKNHRALPFWTTKHIANEARQQHKKQCEPLIRIKYLNEIIRHHHSYNNQSYLQQPKHLIITHQLTQHHGKQTNKSPHWMRDTINTEKNSTTVIRVSKQWQQNEAAARILQRCDPRTTNTARRPPPCHGSCRALIELRYHNEMKRALDGTKPTSASKRGLTVLPNNDKREQPNIPKTVNDLLRQQTAAYAQRVSRYDARSVENHTRPSSATQTKPFRQNAQRVMLRGTSRKSAHLRKWENSTKSLKSLPCDTHNTNHPHEQQTVGTPTITIGTVINDQNYRPHNR